MMKRVKERPTLEAENEFSALVSSSSCCFPALFLISSALVGGAALNTASRIGPSSSTNERLPFKTCATPSGKRPNFVTRVSRTIDETLPKSYDSGSCEPHPWPEILYIFSECSLGGQRKNSHYFVLMIRDAFVTFGEEGLNNGKREDDEG